MKFLVILNVGKCTVTETMYFSVRSTSSPYINKGLELLSINIWATAIGNQFATIKSGKQT